ncbi:MAG: DUF1840 domain-containing protein [Burkholderiales bacterium]|jgi:hypothetical protein|nr:DUF1840 domain-containing protein [Burkholderiales bacterium]
MSLVVFRSKAAGEIFMFADTARRIFEILGKDEGPRGVITASQVPDALDRLQAAVDEERAALKAAEDEARGADRRGNADTELSGQRAITLAQRAFPLLEMLRAAQKMKVDVTWGV